MEYHGKKPQKSCYQYNVGHDSRNYPSILPNIGEDMNQDIDEDIDEDYSENYIEDDISSFSN